MSKLGKETKVESVVVNDKDSDGEVEEYQGANFFNGALIKTTKIPNDFDL